MKILEKDKEPLDIFCEASDILNSAVEHTLGPKGTNTAVQNSKGLYNIINDGKSIIENITSLDPVISPALETLKQASFETNRKAGDGTTSTTIITNSLLQGARKYLLDHPEVSRVELRNRLLDIKEKLLEELQNIKKEVSQKDYKNIAKVALGDDKYSELIEDIYVFLPKGDRPTILKSDIPNIEVEKIDGVNLTKIELISSLFLNTKELQDVDIILLFEPVNRFQEITQLLRKVTQTNKSTILFYNKLSTDILENILFNYTNGAIKLIPIGLGGYGQGIYSIMEELADYCGGNIIDGTKCKLVEISKILFGHIDYAALNSNQIIMKNTEKKIEKKYLHLKEKSVLFRVGGTNIVEQEETFRRIEDAINSVGNAIDYGQVIGAGYTYSKLINSIDTGDEIIPQFVIDSMDLIKKLIGIKDTTNIYDSAMVTREVINNSFTVVSQVITTQAVVHENIR